MYYGEKLNAWTHLVGTILALAGTVLIIGSAALDGDPWKVVSVSVYGTTLIILYSASTLYHSVRGRAKTVFRKFDHHSIYLLIAGSYTPFCLVSLRESCGWSMFGTVWGLAVLGILQELRPRNEARFVSLLIYVVMGWAALAALVPLKSALGASGFFWLAVGGCVYTLGIVFYVLDTRMRHAHGIWHIFVIAGSVIHYFTVLFYVL